MPPIRKAIGVKAFDPELLPEIERPQYEGFLRRRQTTRIFQKLAREGTPLKQIVRQTGLGVLCFVVVVCKISLSGKSDTSAKGWEVAYYFENGGDIDWGAFHRER